MLTTKLRRLLMAALALSLAGAAAPAKADSTLLSLPNATGLTGGEYLYGVQGGVDRKLSVAQLATFVSLNLATGSVFAPLAFSGSAADLTTGILPGARLNGVAPLIANNGSEYNAAAFRTNIGVGALGLLPNLNGVDASTATITASTGSAFPLSTAFPYYDVRFYHQSGDTDDSAASVRAFTACYAGGGGYVWYPPKGSAYNVGTGLSLNGNTCVAKGVGVANWPGPVGTKAQWTAAGSWIACNDTVYPCFTFNGSGGVEGLNFWEDQPTPSTTAGTSWVPNDSPFKVVFKQNFSHISDTQFANVSRGFSFSYASTANIAGSYSYFNNIFMGSFRIGAQFNSVNDTMYCSNYHNRHLWNVDNPNVLTYLTTQSIGWDVEYLDNTICRGVEFYKTAIGIFFRNGSAVYGGTTVTHAAENLQISGVQFNLTPQAMTVADGNTVVSGIFSDVGGQTDTDESVAATNMFELGSNNADMTFNNVQIGASGKNLFNIGAGASGRLRINGINVGGPVGAGAPLGYGYLTAGSHAFVMGAGSTLDIPGGTQNVRPASGAGSITACKATSNCGTVLAVVPATTPTLP